MSLEMHGYPSMPNTSGIGVEVLQRGSPHISELISRLPSRAIDVLVLTPPRVLDCLFPGFLEGRYLRAAYADNPAKFIPDQELRDVILFAGNEDYDGLKTYVGKKIDQLGKFFGVRNRKEIGLRTDNIKAALGIVERSLEGQQRRTGEPKFAHILRVVASGIDLIYENLSMHNSGKPNIFFTQETAELFLVACAIHDFTEEDPIIIEDGTERKTEQFGRVRPEVIIQWKKDVSRGIILERVQRTIDKTKTPKSEEAVIDKVRLDIDTDYFPFLRIALEGLNSAGREEEEIISHLQEVVNATEKKMTFSFLSQLMLYAIPYLVKILDRLDNFATYTYKIDERFDIFWQKYVPASLEDIIEKANKTLTKFSEAEKELLHIMSNWEAQYYLDIFFHKKVLEGMFRSKILSYLPRRWAILTLFGLGPDQMYRKSRRDVDFADVPWTI